MSEFLQKPQQTQAGVRPLKLDAGLSHRVQSSFGINPAQLELGESAQVRAMGARAITKGNVIQFAPGEFSPHTPEGATMLGHELAHAASQASGETPMTGGLLDNSALESSADRAGAAFATGTLSAASPVSLAGAESAPVQMWGSKKKKAAPAPTVPSKYAQTKQATQGLADSGDNVGALEYMKKTLDEETAPLTSLTRHKDYTRQNGGFQGAASAILASTSTVKQVSAYTRTFVPYLTAGHDTPEFREQVSNYLIPGIFNLVNQSIPEDTLLQAILGTTARGLDPHGVLPQNAYNDVMGYTLNMLVLRGICPALATLGAEVGSTDSEMQEKYTEISRAVQMSANAFLLGGALNTGNHLRLDASQMQMFQDTRTTLENNQGSIDDLKRTSPGYVSAKYWKSGSTEPLTPSQQALMDKWNTFPSSEAAQAEDPYGGSMSAPPQSVPTSVPASVLSSHANMQALQAAVSPPQSVPASVLASQATMQAAQASHPAKKSRNPFSFLSRLFKGKK